MKLIVPALTWQSAMAALRHPPHDRERVAYLEGPRPDGVIAIATMLTLLAAEEREGNYYVSAEETSRAGRHLRRYELIRLAQIHSHSAAWTSHSPYDDEMAFSQRDAAISSHGEKGDTVRIVPSLVDLRS